MTSTSKCLSPTMSTSLSAKLCVQLFLNVPGPNSPQNPLIVDVIVGGIVVDFLLALPGYKRRSSNTQFNAI